MQVSWSRNVATAVVCLAACVSGCTTDSTPAATDSIELTPDSQTIGIGATQAFKAEVVKGGNRTDVTDDAAWTSSDQSVATVDSSGVATGVAKGTTTITASLKGTTASATLTVTDATLTELTLSPAKPTLAVGTTKEFTLTGTFSDGTSHDVSNSSGISWTSSNESVAKVSNKGVATAQTTGSSVISAKLSGITGSTSLTVTAAELTSLAIDPTTVSLANGTAHVLTVTGTYSDMSTQDLSGDSDWSSDDASVAEVSNSGDSKGTVSAKKPGTTSIKAAFGGQTATAAVVVTDASLVSIAISPPNPALANGSSTLLLATGTFSDGSMQDISSTVIWTSTDTAVATVSNAAGSKGRVTGAKKGTSAIAAKRGDVSGNVTLTVRDAELVSISVTASNANLPKGTSLQLTATGIYSDATSQDITAAVSWHSSDSDVVSVDDSDAHKGKAQGQALGTATITATWNTITGNKALTVSDAVLASIALMPLEIEIAEGTKTTFTAIGTFTDGSTQDVSSTATWSSSSTDKATISNGSGTHGQATAVAAGTTQITAAQGGVTSPGSTLTVTDATLVSIDITPANPTIAKGTTQQFVATGTFSDTTTQNLTTEVNWTSSAGAVVISNSDGSRGLATGMTTGAAVIHASKSGVTSDPVTLIVTPAELVSIAITPSTPTIPKGRTQQFIASGTFTDSSHQDLTSSVTWVSSVPVKASITNGGGGGLASGLIAGTTSITASYGGKTSNAVTLTVSPADLVGIEIDPPSASIANGTTQQFTATGIYTDSSHPNLTSSVTWSSSMPSVAMISGLGLASAHGSGSTTIQASLNGINSPDVLLNVTNAELSTITISPGIATIHKGQTRQYYAMGAFTDTTIQDLTSVVTWGSDSPSVSISNTNVSSTKGEATGVSVGSATITASYNGVDSNAADATVDAAVLTSIALTPGSLVLAKGTSTDFTALGSYSDGLNPGDVTNTVTWTSSNPLIATISNAPGSHGHVDTLLAGDVTITATDPTTQVAMTASLSVTAATVMTIEVTPSTQAIAQQTKQQFTATGIFTDHTQQDLTSAAHWSSDNLAVSISNAPGSIGLATAGMVVSSELANITASYSGATGGTTLTVTPATLTSIVVETDTPTRPKGLTANFTATGFFSQGNPQDLTTQVSWLSTVPATATISNAIGSEGTASTVAPGTTLISASLLGQTGSALLLVTSAEISSIQLTGPSQAPKGTTAHYVATGTFTDGTHSDVTGSVDWSSSDPLIAALCASQGADECFDALTQGPTTITASKVTSLTTVSEDIILTVTPASLVSIAVTSTDNVDLPEGLTRQYTATGTYSDGSTNDITSGVTWGVSNSAAADISNDDPKGLLTAKLMGTTNVIATQGIRVGTISLNVAAAILQRIDITTPPASLPKGLKFQFQAQGTYSNDTTLPITDLVQWDTNMHLFATISNAVGHRGEVTGVDVGDVTVTALLNNGTTDITGSTSLTVSSAVLQTIDIQAAFSSIALGTSEPFTATGNYSDLTSIDITTHVDWSSSNTSAATIGLHTGSAQSIALGQTTITASLDGKTKTYDLTVRAAELTTIQVGTVGAIGSTPNGTSVQFTATGIYTDLHHQDLTTQVVWSVDHIGIATISNANGSRGILTGHSLGSVIVTATDQASSIPGSTNFGISAAVVQNLSLSPLTPIIANGTTKQFSVVANYSDGTHPTVTTTTTWDTSNTAIALISRTAPSKGLASSVSVGTTTITATFGGQMASTTLTVTDATLVTITVTPASSSTPLGFTKRFTATGTYTDMTTQDLSNAVQWTSSNEAAAIISNATGSKGLASTVGSTLGNNTTTIRATLDTKFGQTSFTVSNAILQSILVSPDDSTLNACVCQPLSALGHFSDGTDVDITSTVTFTSSNSAIVNVANTGSIGTPVFSICPTSALGAVDITATEPSSGVQGDTSATNGISCN